MNYIIKSETENKNNNKNNNLIIIDNNKPIIIPSKLYPYHNLHNLQNIAKLKWKDQRLEQVEIPRGLIEVLQNAGFTIEMILESESSDIAEKLGIDDYVAQIIFNETRAFNSFNKSYSESKESLYYY